MKRFAVALATLSLVVTQLMVAATVSAADPDAVPGPFSHLDTTAVGVNGSFKPAVLANNRVSGFILTLAGKSVGQARIDARKAGKDLSKVQRDAIRASLVRAQARVQRAVRALGGRVVERYQDAYNGLSVRIPLKNVVKLAALPGVTAIHPIRIVERDNVAGVQYIGGNGAWTTGFTGAGVKIAVIDTGIDYYHANFAGSGNPADFANDNGLTTGTAAFPNSKVAGGYDFVGDAYDAGSADPAHSTPHPDPDPLDCNGHGSHTAGTAAGFGVLSTGATFHGPYDSSTYSSNTFTVGPGVAPDATIYAYRVFGCEGSATDEVIVAALNRALADGVNVVNMSLGSVFGRADAPDSVASDVLAQNGVVVVASAGNSGPGGYVTGSPAVADRVLSVAAIDASSPTFPGATIPLSTGQTITAIEANGPFQGDPGPALPSGALSVAVLRTSYPSGPVSLGCDPAEYAQYPGGVTGKLVVTLRGTCARVARAIFGQQAGAAAVAMINTSTTYPPYEGDITSNPDTGAPYHVTIPFFGVRGVLGGAGDADRLVAADGGTANSFTAATVPNTAYQVAASFTSGGPRNVDSAIKPEVIAPGVSVKSTAMGSGTQGTRMSGTSMASPMTAGAAALVMQAHPGWSSDAIKAALIDTSNASSAKILGYNLRTAGTGVVDAVKAVATVAYATTTGGTDTLSYGYRALGAAYTATQSLSFHNTSASAITYTLAASTNGGQLGTTVSFSASSVTVPAGGSNSVDVTLSLTASAVAALPGAEASIFGSIVTVRGAVVATPTSSATGVYPLRVPYLLVPRGTSDITNGARSGYTRGAGISTATLPVSNAGIHGGTADVYAWGIHDANDVGGGEDAVDVRDVGVQVQPKAFLCGTDTTGVCSHADDRSLIFAVNVYGAASNPAISEIDIPIDLQSDGRPDYFVVGVDFGAVTAGAFSGQYASFIFDAAGNIVDLWVADAPMNGSTVLLPTLASEIGLDPAVNSTRFRYAVAAFSIVPGGIVDVTAAATFRSHQPPVSTGQQVPLAPGGSSVIPLWVDRGKQAGTPQLGWLVVGLDDANGTVQANEVPIGTP
jgi:minor extracellular serine protease Vpr